mgnify:FL=1
MSESDWDDYDEEEDSEEHRDVSQYEKLGLEWPGGPYVQPTRWYVDGFLGGDIKWNSIDAKIYMQIPYTEARRAEFEAHRKLYRTGIHPYVNTFQAYVRPFTHNCGAKTIGDLSMVGTSEECKLFMTYLESFLWHKCNCGLIVGSDYVDGTDVGYTGYCVKTYGTGYTVEEPTWNPNYTWKNGRDHKIFLFHKQLTEANAPVNYWS